MPTITYLHAGSGKKLTASPTSWELEKLEEAALRGTFAFLRMKQFLGEVRTLRIEFFLEKFRNSHQLKRTLARLRRQPARRASANVRHQLYHGDLDLLGG